MRKSFYLLLVPFLSHSQFDYAVKIHNNAREIYTNYSINYNQLDENGYGQVSKIYYSKKLADEAQERADKLAEEFFKWHEGDNKNNFWFTEIAIGNDGSKVFLSDREYVTNAALSWTQLEFEYEKYKNGEEICFESNDISDFLNVVWSNNTQVGFGISKSNTHVFVVASYDFSY